MAAPKPIIPGETFGRLTVLAEGPRSNTHQRQASCRCVCGTIVTVPMAALRSRGPQQSCGCWQREWTRQHNWKHGANQRGRRLPEYGVWADAKGRCANPRRKTWSGYGGRGITMCARWRDSFAAFLADMGPRPSPAHSLERVNNDDGYSPSGHV